MVGEEVAIHFLTRQERVVRQDVQSMTFQPPQIAVYGRVVPEVVDGSCSSGRGAIEGWARGF